MIQEQKDYFDSMSEMMATKGWKLFISDLEKNLEATKQTLMSQATLETFFVGKGRVQVFIDIIGLQSFLEHTYKSLQEADEDAPL